MALLAKILQTCFSRDKTRATGKDTALQKNILALVSHVRIFRVKSTQVRTKTHVISRSSNQFM